MRPTSLGDLRQTSLQAGGLFKRPHVVSPPFTINTGGGGFYVDDSGRPLSFYVDDLGRHLNFYVDDNGRRL